MNNKSSSILLCQFLVLAIFHNGFGYASQKQIVIDEIHDLIAEAQRGERIDKWECKIWDLWYEEWRTGKKHPITNSYIYFVVVYLVKTDRDTYRYFLFNKLADSSKPLLEFWSIEIESFVFYDDRRLKLILMRETESEIIALNFLNAPTAQQFWYHATENKLASKNEKLLFTATHCETYHNLSGLRLNSSKEIRIEKNSIADRFASYTLWTDDPKKENGVDRKVISIFSSNQFTLSNVLNGCVGILLSEAPQHIHILHFNKDETALAFHEDIMSQRNEKIDLISDNLMMDFILPDRDSTISI